MDEEPRPRSSSAGAVLVYFVFLHQHRLTLFDAAFQDQLATIYQDAPAGQPPIPPAQLVLATILQAYTGVSDDELLEATLMDRRWQLVLDCLDCDTPPFSKGTLVTFRKLLIAQQLDRRLLERTLELAAATKAFGSRNPRAAAVRKANEPGLAGPL